MGKQSKRALSLALFAMASGTSDGFAVRTKRSRTDMTALTYRTEEVVHTEASNYFCYNPLLQQPVSHAATTTTTTDNPLLHHTMNLNAQHDFNYDYNDIDDDESSSEDNDKLPSWLKVQRSHLMEQNVEELKQHMLSSFYTESEASKLIFAIEEAALGDRNTMAGAAEFCLILVDTMEMGLNTLIAAAFHYCSCLETRKEQSKDDTFSVWEPKEHDGIRMFGAHATEIARDAARLKKIEMVFSSIVPNPSGLLSKDANNLRNLLVTDTRDWRALAMRSAACLFRLRGIPTTERLTPEAVRASREALTIFAPLASRLGMHRLKNELEDAAFKTLYRRQYETVTSLARQMRYKKFESGVTRRSLIDLADDEDEEALNIGESMKCVLESVKQDMEEVLSKDPVFSTATESFHVSARVKEPYSMWKKMLRNRVDDVLQVPDALALRIVLNAKKMSPDEPEEMTRARERALCYYAQKKCTYNWEPSDADPRFKDYVENPKPNGYQSLHYTASTEWQDEDWTLEIQIRSGEMHKVAEYGLASHWDYKAKSKGSSNNDYSSDSYLRKVQEWHWEQQSGAIQWDAAPSSDDYELMNDVERNLRDERIRKRNKELAPYLQALNTAQSNLARDHVFVFLSQQSADEGNIIALPAGACVMDALKAVGGSRLPFLNGDATTLTQQLRNGDLLEVPTLESVRELVSL